MPKIIPAIDPGKPVLTTAEAAVFLGVTPKTLTGYRLMRRIGGKVWYHPDDLRAFANPKAKPDLLPGKTSEATKQTLRSMGFKI